MSKLDNSCRQREVEKAKKERYMNHSNKAAGVGTEAERGDEEAIMVVVREDTNNSREEVRVF